jgi:ubiquinone/menaquinone biosynthesis C-methylase UbiE
MSKEIKNWWEDNAIDYQKDHKIKIDISYGRGSPNEKVLNLIGNVKGKRVLELGCGGAQAGIAFARKGAKVTGIDISEKQIKFATFLTKKNNVDIKLYRGDVSKLDMIKSNTQDIIFSAWAFEYVGDLTKCFKETNRVLKKQGIFIFSLDHPFWGVVNKASMKVRRSYFDSGIYKEPHRKGIFVGYYHTLSELINPLIEAGFTIEKIIEPDSRKKNVGDYWYGNQDKKRRNAMKFIPSTIIIKAKKK